jgi:hypothetical protein
MKTRKNFTLIFVLGLLLSAFAAVNAQTPSQGDQKKTTESCCCCADSCDMKMKDDATMKHDMKGQKGDCCNMKQKSKDKKAA